MKKIKPKILKTRDKQIVLQRGMVFLSHKWLIIFLLERKIWCKCLRNNNKLHFREVCNISTAVDAIFISFLNFPRGGIVLKKLY